MYVVLNYTSAQDCSSRRFVVILAKTKAHFEAVSTFAMPRNKLALNFKQLRERVFISWEQK